MPAHIRLSAVTDAVVTLTLDRPEKKNAPSIALRDEVTAALGALAADTHVKLTQREAGAVEQIRRATSVAAIMLAGCNLNG